MTDVLYGGDLGSVAASPSGSVKDGQTFNVYTDNQGVNQITTLKDCASNFTVGAGNGGTVTATSLGRILFYAPNTTDTLWLKNGSNFWAINPTSLAGAFQGKLDTLQATNAGLTNALSDRVSATEDAIDDLDVAPRWQEWRGKVGVAKMTTSGNYASLNFASNITTPDAFVVNMDTDQVGVTVPGWYRVALRVGFLANPAGYRGAQIVLNGGLTSMDQATASGSVVAASNSLAVAGATSTAAVTEDFYLTPVDALLFVAYQNSGGSLGVDIAKQYTSATIAYLGAA